MEQNQSIMTVDSLTKTFHKDGELLYALKNVSFELYKGEVLGVIGRNGAGKSTLLKVLSQITGPSSGEVSYEGQLTSIIDIGTGFHADLSGEENIYLSALLLGYSKKEIKELYTEIVDFSGLHDFMQMPVKHYSSGMYLRLAFSIAFNTKIDILLLDEVIAVGDSDFKRKCYAKIKELKQRGIAIILVSHHLSIIAEQCDRCLLLDKGAIQMEGNPIDVVDKYYEIVDNHQDLSVNEELDLNQSFDKGISFLCPLPIRFDHVVVEDILVQGNDESEILTTSDIHFEFQCEKLKNVGSFEVVLYITNLSGIRVLMDSAGFRDDYDEVKHESRGKYSVRSIIPKDLLSAGVYKMGMMICENRLLIQDIENVLKFRISSDGEIGDRGMGSIIRPKLNWKIEKN